MGRVIRSISVATKYGFAIIFLVIIGIILWFRANPLGECNNYEKIINRNADGYSVFYVRDLCDGMASSDTESLDLVLPSGERDTILRFDYPDHSKSEEDFKAISIEGAHLPKVTWSDGRTLHVEIGVVGNVQKRLDAIGGINIVFDIHRIVLE